MCIRDRHKGETLSGEDIGRELSCTRAAVWKAVNSLRQEGYPIEAGPNKGYMLARESNLISAEGIRLFLDDPQVEIKIFDAISSTNLEARQLAVRGMAGHGSFVVAMEQTAGRGRRGREFYSPKGSGIYLSVILEPKGTLEGSLLITTAAATAVYKAVKEVCGVKLGIKWVNDLYKDNRKVCGILTEADVYKRQRILLTISIPGFLPEDSSQSALQGGSCPQFWRIVHLRRFLRQFPEVLLGIVPAQRTGSAQFLQLQILYFHFQNL